MSQPAPGTAAASPGDCRCLCGSLLARWVEDGVELKCRRCKRTIRLPLSPDAPRGVLRRVPVGPAGEAG